MGSMMIVVPLVVAALGFIVFLTGIGHAVRLRPGRATVGLGGGGVLAIVGLAAGLVGINMQTYARLTYEVPLAEVTVHAVDPAQKIYTVSVLRLDGTNRAQNCTLQGDAWEIGGRFQKWKPWANIIGLNATYTLDQLSNRYYSAAEANGQKITACDINGPAPKVDQYLPESWGKWLMSQMMVEDRFFGSASFMPMADGAKYKVIATQFGFNAEPANEAGANANSQRAF